MKNSVAIATTVMVSTVRSLLRPMFAQQCW
jgi:hypothetical protein